MASSTSLCLTSRHAVCGHQHHRQLPRFDGLQEGAERVGAKVGADGLMVYGNLWMLSKQGVG